MKRNVYEQVAHAKYLSQGKERIERGADPRSIESYRKYKYKKQSLDITETISETPVTPLECRLQENNVSMDPIEELKELTVNQENSNDTCTIQDEEQMKEADDLMKMRHEYLMQLICPALRYRKPYSLSQVDTNTTDTMEAARPCARDGASLTSCGNLLVLFGGCYISDPSLLHPRAIVPPSETAKGSIYFSNHLFICIMDTKTWEVPRTSGTAPCGRADHSAVYTPNDESLIVFGGRGKQAKVFQDTFVLQLTAWTWSEVKCTSATPSPRFWHSAAQCNDDMIYVFGGKDLYTVYGDMLCLQPNLEWSSVSAFGQPPPPRFGANLHALNDGRLLVVGGWESRSVPLNDTNRWLDLYVLDTVLGLWSRPHLSAHFHCQSIPTERMIFSSFYFASSSTLLVFGGYTYEPVEARRSWYELEPPPPTVGLGTPERLLHGMSLVPVHDQGIFTLNINVLVWRRQRYQKQLPTSVACGAGAVMNQIGFVAAISTCIPTKLDLIQVESEDNKPHKTIGSSELMKST